MVLGRLLALSVAVWIVTLPVPAADAGTVMCRGEAATVTGTSRDDTLVGTDDDDVIAGRGGDDRMLGLDGADLVCGGRGDDTFVGGPGDDRIDGGAGRDTLDYSDEDVGTYTRVNLPGGTAERASGTYDRDILHGETIENVVLNCTTAENDWVTGDEHDNYISGSATTNYLSGGRGKDTILGAGGPDELSGGKGHDRIYGDFPSGDPAFDNCLRRDRSDYLTGAHGNDVLSGNEDEDAIRGGRGDDVVRGGKWADLCSGNRGHDLRRRCERRVPVGKGCNDPGTESDLSQEPNYSANLKRWTNSQGCDVRLDILTTSRGPEHCSWEESRTTSMAVPLGQRLTPWTTNRTYVKDPKNVLGDRRTSRRFQRNANLPADAYDTGYQRNKWTLWLVADDSDFLYRVSADRTERWPLDQIGAGCV